MDRIKAAEKKVFVRSMVPKPYDRHPMVNGIASDSISRLALLKQEENQHPEPS